MKLSRVIGRYFDDWISQDSWDSHHPSDDARFYRFVKAVARYSRRRVPSQGDVRALIIQRWSRQEGDNVELEKIANEFAELYQTLLDYEQTRGFPDPFREGIDIVKCYLKLSIHSQGNDQYINRTMTEDWGKDWRAKLDRAISEARVGGRGDRPT
jgi:hypothetical protein